MNQELKLTGYFAGALLIGQEIYGNRILAAEIDRVSQGILRLDTPQEWDDPYRFFGW